MRTQSAFLVLAVAASSGCSVSKSSRSESKGSFGSRFVTSLLSSAVDSAFNRNERDRRSYRADLEYRDQAQADRYERGWREQRIQADNLREFSQSDRRITEADEDAFVMPELDFEIDESWVEEARRNVANGLPRETAPPLE